MERIKCLNLYQKKILLFIVLIMLVFTVIYPIIIAREGFAYKDAILIPNQENDSVVYTGKIQGKQASFTVSPEKTVEFRYGDKFYGPYTLKVDSSAIPKSKEMEV